MHAQGIQVDDALMQRWVTYLAPPAQPFLVSGALAAELPTTPAVELTLTLRDTYEIYGDLGDGVELIWLDETAYDRLPVVLRTRLVREQLAHGREAVPSVRGWVDVADRTLLRSQVDGHRFVWWSSLLADAPEPVLERFVAGHSFPTLHAEVPSETWLACESLLPGARQLAGTFPEASGPNCFGTVMAAAGVPGAATTWMVQTPFEEWLSGATTRGGHDDVPGTVLVWRDADGLACHAAVTIGDGWALEKPSQGWFTPRGVRRVVDVIRTFRTPGLRLTRYELCG